MQIVGYTEKKLILLRQTARTRPTTVLPPELLRRSLPRFFLGPVGNGPIAREERGPRLAEAIGAGLGVYSNVFMRAKEYFSKISRMSS